MLQVQSTPSIQHADSNIRASNIRHQVDQSIRIKTGALPLKNVATLSPALSLLVLAGAVVLLLMFSYHATYSSMAYSSPSIVIYAGRTSDGRRVTFTTTKYSS